jgi:glycosyltransferase involved in cell wall biosynthesis
MNHRPTVSVIIPMRNEEKYIGQCLESILNNDFSKEQIEILVVDGRSQDASREVVAAIAKHHPQVRIIDNPKGIVPPGLNTAIRMAKGRYIIRMDAHSEYPAHYISACVQELEKGNADVVGGRLITKPGAETLSARAIALLSQHPFGVGNSGFRLGWQGRYVDTVPFGAFRREIFDRVGLFREGLIRHQDFEMNARIRRAGGRIFLSPEIYFTYYNLPSVSALLRRAFRDGLWVARAWVRYPITFCPRHSAPLVLLLLLTMPFFLSSIVPGAELLSLAILSSYCVLMLVASIQIALRHGLRMLLILPLLFLSFHLVYGAGSLSGLFSGSTIAREAEIPMTEPQSLSEAA